MNQTPKGEARTEPAIDYFVIHDFAEKHGADYNALCVMVRAALAQSRTPSPLTADYIEHHIAPDEDDREAVTAIVREVEDAHRIGVKFTLANHHFTREAAQSRTPEPASGRMELTQAQRDGLTCKNAVAIPGVHPAGAVAEAAPNAKEQYDLLVAPNELESPVERLRAFCSFAMNGQDWLDVEPFFDDLTARCREAAQRAAGGERE